MIITVGGIKGGSGKSTVATNLTVLRVQEGRDVLLVDADTQETATDFTLQRNQRTEGNAGFTCIKLAAAAVRTETLRLAEKYQDVIIDTGGRDTTSQRAALSVSDVLLAPFQPSSFDLWALEQTTQLFTEMQPANPELKGFTFLNKAEARGRDNTEAAEVLREDDAFSFIEDVLLVYRKAYRTAAGRGQAVTEIKPRDDKAINEFLTLYRHLFDVSKMSYAGG